jgi:hypothetical protein
MRHMEASPGESRWFCTNAECGWSASETVAARYLKERPDDPEFQADMTKEEVVAAPALPHGTFTVEGERSPQHPEGLTSKGERPAHVTNRPLGGDEELAVRMEEYAESHGITITDSNVDAIQAQLDVRDAATTAEPKRRAAAEERQRQIAAGRTARDERDPPAERQRRAEEQERRSREAVSRLEEPNPAAPKPEHGK